MFWGFVRKRSTVLKVFKYFPSLVLGYIKTDFYEVNCKWISNERKSHFVILYGKW